MKLVKIDDYLYLNPELIRSVESIASGATVITMDDGDTFQSNLQIEKVVNAIYGSKGPSKMEITPKRAVITADKIYTDASITSYGNKLNIPTYKPAGANGIDNDNKSYMTIDKDGSSISIVVDGKSATVTLQENDRLRSWFVERVKQDEVSTN